MDIVRMQQEILRLSDKMKARLVELDKKSKTGHEYASQTLAYIYGDLGTVAAEIRTNERERKNQGHFEVMKVHSSHSPSLKLTLCRQGVSGLVWDS